MSSICTGQTELCQSPGQGPGVLRPASFQMVEEEDGSLQGDVSTLHPDLF